MMQDFQLHSEDHYILAARKYSSLNAKATIVMASATGVPQGFYRAFAEYANTQGFQVISFDYRGIAASAPADLSQMHMSYLDWGRYDLTAAIACAAVDRLPIFVVGHSYGGQALGLCQNHHLVRAMYCFGTGAGWTGYMPMPERLKVLSFWNLIFPALVAYYGYLPWEKLGMGANLPRDVYVQWKKWCQSPHYFFDDPAYSHLHPQFAQVQCPIYAVSALDDLWALPASREAFMQHYRTAPLHYIDIQPEQYGLNSIGHMGYFRKSAQALWQVMLERFSTYL